MSTKIFIRMTILAVLALSAVLIPLQVQAGGVCGGAYTIEKGDTVDKLAAMCGTSAAVIFAANPGLKEPLTVGQTITIPGANYGILTATATVTVTGTPPTAIPVTVTPVPAVINNYYTYNYYYSNDYYPVASFTMPYVVQPGDTVSSIIYSFGITIQDLIAANPYININNLYAGQTLNIPVAYWAGIPTPVPVVSDKEPTSLSYNDAIPKNAAYARVNLVNKADAEVYISLRSNRADGTVAINEFPVKRREQVEIPVGWIDYVAYVGGVKYTGGFMLREDSLHTITFNRSKVVVD